MIYVEIHQLDKVAGYVGWDGRQFVVNPQLPWLQSILDDTLTDPRTQQQVTAADPERFLYCLQFKYRNPYLQASPPVQK